MDRGVALGEKAMTLAALLEELRVVDPDQSEKLQCWIGRTRQVMNLEMPLECDLAQALIQNSIQRACERRGWPVVLSFDCDPDHPHTWVAEICDGWALLGMAVRHESPSEALLAAYVAAVKEEK